MGSSTRLDREIERLKNYVVCLKHGTKYGPEYVNTLYQMISRNISIDYEFVCFTERPKKLHKNIRIEPLPELGVQGWWYKPMFFNPDLPIKGNILYLDLDVIVFQNIDKFFDFETDKFCIIRDFNRHVNPNWKKMNSSCFRLRTGDQSHVYTNYVNDIKNVSKRFFGDQDWIFSQVKENYEFWPDEWIQSYKWEMRGKPPMTRINGVRNFVNPGEPKILPETSVAVFHGEPNPPQCQDQWVIDNWR